MWSAPKKMDDLEVLRAAFAESNLDGEAIMTLAQTQGVKDELAANTQSAVKRGAFGSPTFFVDGEIYFGKDRLGEVEAAIGASGA